MRPAPFTACSMIVLLAVSVLSVIVLSVSAASAESPKKATPRDRGKSSDRSVAKKAKKATVVTAAREAAALAFVREHHNEVAKLLERLKKRNPSQYKRAVRELFHTSERLGQWKQQDAVRYELELKAWKLKSRIRLLAAQSTMSSETVIDDRLREAVQQQIDVRIELLKHQRAVTAKRVASLDDDIQRMEKQRDKSIDRRLKQLKQKIVKSRGKRAKHGKPGKAPRATKKVSKESPRDLKKPRAVKSPKPLERKR